MKNKLPFILLIACGLLFISLFYGKVLLHPNDYLFGNSGDGIKNYFTYCHHITNDSSYLAFEGMNYPYGEHFFYTDCHPVLANTFKALSSCSDVFSTHSVGILNVIMILSIFLCFVVCYFLLREFAVNRWLSALFSIGITLLSPQIFRLTGHLALSYSVAIPLSWLLLLKCIKQTQKMRYCILLFTNLLFWMLIHAYLGMIVVSFLACIALILFAIEKQKQVLWKSYVKIFAAILLPVIVFYLLATLTDTHLGRTNNPSGFFLYNAEPDDIFVPGSAPFRPLLDALTHNKIKQQWEAYSYVGMASSLFFVSLIVLAIIRLIKRKQPTIIDSFFESRLFNVSLIATGIVLLFALAIPFKQIPALLDIFPIFKQFRATGRFTWPFFFAATMFMALAIQSLYLRAKKQKLILVLGCIVGVLNIVEGLPYHTSISENITQARNVFNKTQLSANYVAALKSIHSDDYQAMLTLPFYYQGSESFGRAWSDETMRASMCISYHTGLPLFCADLTRTSVQESKNIIQIVSPNFYTKPIINDLPSNKPILVIRTTDAITAYEADIFAKCKPIFQSAELSLYSISKEDLFKNNAQATFEEYQKRKPNLYAKNGFLLSKDSTFLYYDNFDNRKSEHPFRGAGGFQATKKGKNTFAEFAPNTFETGKNYHIAVWMYNGHQDALNLWFRFIIEEYNEANNTWDETTYFPEQSEVINGNWSMIEASFVVKNPQNRIYIVSKGKDDEKPPLFVDDLLITEEGVAVYRYDELRKTLFFNNHDVHLVNQ